MLEFRPLLAFRRRLVSGHGFEYGHGLEFRLELEFVYGVEFATRLGYKHGLVFKLVLRPWVRVQARVAFRFAAVRSLLRCCEFPGAYLPRGHIYQLRLGRIS